MEPYYYMQLDKQQQAAYRDMKAGLQALAPSFLVTRLENRVLGDIFFQLRLDCPEFFMPWAFNTVFIRILPKWSMILSARAFAMIN